MFSFLNLHLPIGGFNIFIFLVVGLIVGVLLGLTGAGGSVFAVPLLVLLAGLSAVDASGLALFAVALSAIVGVLMQWRQKQVLVQPSVVITVAAVITAPLGRWSSASFSDAIVLGFFAVLSFAIAGWMWYTSSGKSENIAVRGSLKNAGIGPAPICRMSPVEGRLQPRCFYSLIMGGIVVGFLSGFMGVGGGFLMVPLLLWVTRAPMVNAVSSSLVIIAIVSLVGFCSHILIVKSLPWMEALLLAFGAAAGMVISSKLAAKLNGRLLQKIFAIALVVMSIAVWLWRL